MCSPLLLLLCSGTASKEFALEVAGEIQSPQDQRLRQGASPLAECLASLTQYMAPSTSASMRQYSIWLE